MVHKKYTVHTENSKQDGKSDQQYKNIYYTPQKKLQPPWSRIHFGAEECVPSRANYIKNTTDKMA